MKAAAAVLGASLLFFVGVLTGAGRREAVPPPAAITLGVGAGSSPAGEPPATGPRPSSPSPGATTPAPPGATSSTTRTDATTPPASTEPPVPDEPPATTTSTTGGGSDATATTTATTGRVEQVDGQVDCRSDRKPGKGKREPCPPTTTSTAEAPGGGRNR